MALLYRDREEIREMRSGSGERTTLSAKQTGADYAGVIA